MLPLDVVAELVGKVCHDDVMCILLDINDYIHNGTVTSLIDASETFIHYAYGGDILTAMLELSHHYSDGAKKYAERNWEQGLPLHSFIDSGVRHLLKYCRSDDDEPHDRAFLWNMLGAVWTHRNHPELIDLPFKHKEE